MTDEDKLLKSRLEALDFRVVEKLQKIKYTEGWAERKKKGHEIRMLILSAVGHIEAGRKSELQTKLEELDSLGLKY